MESHPRPRLILVAGPPGSGKTTLAGRLAEVLNLPLISKDSIKVTLAESIGADGVEQAQRLGAAAVAMLYETARAILSGGSGLIVESAFWRDLVSELDPLLALGSARLIRCTVPVGIAVDRYRTRERHWIHFDRERADDMGSHIAAGDFDISLPVPTIDIDTTDGYRPTLDAIVEFVGGANMQVAAHRPAATVHMLHGFLCVGKSRVARQLEMDTGAVRLTLDDWTIAASGDREHLDPDLYDRVRGALERHWISLARRGIDVILDFGFWTRAERDAARAAAEKLGARALLYCVTCPEEVARERCALRNDQSSVDYYFAEGAYDALKAKFEALGPDEEHTLVST